MEKPTAETVADALKKLASEDGSRSKTARLREVLPEIEAAQKAGVRNQKIVETLNAHGFELNLKTFETTLYRIRKKPGKETKSTAATPQKGTPKEGAKNAPTQRPLEKRALPISRKPEVNLDDYLDNED
jgi:hypothetical protein